MFTEYVLSWCYPVRTFVDGNKTIDTIKTLTKAEAVKYFRRAYPDLDNDGYQKFKNGSLIMAEIYKPLGY